MHLCRITKEKGDKWERINNAVSIYRKLVNDGFEISTLITNYSLALLGFYFALLIQFKLSEINYLSIVTFVPLIFIVSALVLGFYLKIRHELRGSFDDLVEMGIELTRPSESNEDQEERNEEQKRPVEKFLSRLDHIKQYIPINLILTQIYFFVVSVILIIYSLLKFLLFN